MKKILLAIILTTMTFSAFAQNDSISISSCGLIGNVEDRIKDCSSQDGSQKEGFVLVTRTRNHKEVYQEISTGLLWTDRLSKLYNHRERALKACNEVVEEMGWISAQWKLPSRKEYAEAERSGIRNVSDIREWWFWTSSTRNPHGGGSYFYNGYHGHFDVVHSNTISGAVRCTVKVNSTFK